MAAKKKARKRPEKKPAGARFPVSSAAVREKTGRDWQQWLGVIDAEGGRKLGHKAIAALLESKYAVPMWWAQSVTVGYERARGLRVRHQTADGFSVSASRVIGAGVSAVYDAWLDPRKRARWLPGTAIAIHRSTRNKSLRATWTDGAKSIDVYFAPRGPGRTQVSLGHGKLPDAAAAKKMKSFWSARLDALRELLSG